MANQINCSVVFTLFNVTFLGKWDECGERPFLWPLTSFPDRHAYSVHSVQCCLSSCFEQFCWDVIRTCGFTTCCLTDHRSNLWTKWWRLFLPIFFFSSIPFLIVVQIFTILFPSVCDLCSFSQIFASYWLDTLQARWNFRVIDLTIWMTCLEFPFVFAAFNSAHMPSSCCRLSTLSFFCTSAFSSWYRFLSFSFASLYA